MRDELKVIAAAENDEDKIGMLVNLIKNQVDWNGTYSKYINTTLRNAWTNKSGTTGDINLMLVAGLRELGFTADPVLISTRGHGMLREQFAISKQFNSVLALVQLKDGYVLLDATDKYVPAGALPAKCLNGKGWRVSNTSRGFVQLNPSANHEVQIAGIVTLSDDGMASTDLTTKRKGYAAFAAYKSYKKKGKEDYVQSIRDNNAEWELEEIEIDDSKGSVGPFISTYKLTTDKDIISGGDMIYFNPLMGQLLNENPFKIEKRTYPVDFTQPLVRTCSFAFTLPEGYSVEEFPEEMAIGLPDKAGTFIYKVVANGSTIQATAKLEINKPLFNSLEYSSLKEFYDKAVQKCAEQVVIKKKT